MSRIPGASKKEAIRPIHKIFYASQSPSAEAVRLGRRIGTGAEGEVYEIQDRDDLVAKVYHEPPPQEKAEKLVALSRLGNERLFNLSAWPVSTLRDAPDGDVVGFMMKKISQAEEVHALHSPKSRLQKFPEASWAFLIYVAANVARAAAAVHEHGLVIGDLHPKNILVTRKATVYLLDVDSFQVSAEGKTYRCEGGFPEYTPPELQGVAFRDVDRVQGHDSFGLAVVIFQLLFMGRHPFSGRYLGAGEMPLERAIREFRFAYGADAETRKMRQPPGTLALDSMPSPLLELFRRSFLSADRPRPREWIEPLEALAMALKKCGLHSGHYYYQELRDCPWCGIESQARVRLFNFLLHGEDSRRGHFRLDEIWNEIVSVEAPGASLIQWDKILKSPAPSAEIRAFSGVRDNRLSIALIFSAFAGLAIGLLVGFPLAFIMLILAGLIVWAITRVDAPLLESVQARQRSAKEEAQRLQEQYDLELANDLWDAKRDELRNRRETYENLAQVRHLRLQQLEAEAKKNQLEEFLDQFEINYAEIKGVNPTVKTVLLSHGVETAADVSEIKGLRQIPSIGILRAKWLVEWRRGLEQKFVFDPAKGVPLEARIRTERCVDALRFRLESELIEGARHLRYLKQEIEAGRRRLQPALAQARQALAQAEKDLEVASRRNSPLLILTALIITFWIGYLFHGASFAREGPAEIRREDPGSPAFSSGETNKLLSSRMLYSKWARLEKWKSDIEAGDTLRMAVSLDPKFGPSSSQDLGKMLFHVKLHGKDFDLYEPIFSPSFESYHRLGKLHSEAGNWKGASLAFRLAIELRDPSSWKDDYTEAYYYLGISLVKTGDVYMEIQALEADAGFPQGDPIKHFELANLFLCIGCEESAKEQYRLLKDRAPKLAEELLKLMKKHGISA